MKNPRLLFRFPIDDLSHVTDHTNLNNDKFENPIKENQLYKSPIVICLFTLHGASIKYHRELEVGLTWWIIIASDLTRWNKKSNERKVIYAWKSLEIRIVDLAIYSPEQQWLIQL